jgi:predicted secreted hydrolase
VSHGALLGFKQAVPGYGLKFPADHAAHPDYRTEWWYYTGHLQTTTGKRYGYELTFFRHRVDSSGPTINPSKWFADNVYMAHMAITDETAKLFIYGEKLNRAALGLAGASEQRYHVWNEDWLAERLGSVQHLAGEIPGYKLNLIVTPQYLKKVLTTHPEATVYAVRLDRGMSSPEILRTIPGERWDEENGLNELQYIVPGGGGFGEIMNNAYV